MDFFNPPNCTKIEKYTVNKNWGNYIWGTIHEVAIGYPEFPTDEDKKLYKNFYDNLIKVLPCPICKTDFIDIKNSNPIVLDNRDALFNWTVDLHNAVNLKLGGHIWTYEEAIKQWTFKYYEFIHK